WRPCLMSLSATLSNRLIFITLPLHDYVLPPLTDGSKSMPLVHGQRPLIDRGPGYRRPAGQPLPQTGLEKLLVHTLPPRRWRHVIVPKLPKVFAAPGCYEADGFAGLVDGQPPNRRLVTGNRSPQFPAHGRRHQEGANTL